MQTSKIIKWGNSQGIRLPKHILDSANLADNDVVEIIAKKDSIIIKKVKTKKAHKTIQERFEGFSGEYEPTEIDWGKPEGKELW